MSGRTAVAELVLYAAETVLLNIKAGRIYDPLTVEWAEFLVKHNRRQPAPKPVQEPTGEPTT